MITDFYIISGETVPTNYTWDIGNPLETTPTTVIADSTTEYISGYAPGLKVVFKSDISDLIYSAFPDVSASYTWDFGDYYNSYNNEVSLQCKDVILEHTYILPGKYTVTLTNIQSREFKPVVEPTDSTCFGKYNIGWYWENLVCGTTNQTQWNETMCIPPATAVNPRPKNWFSEDICFGKHCLKWMWGELACTPGKLSRNPIRWNQTWKYSEYDKRWVDEIAGNACAPPDIPQSVIQTTEQIAQKTAMVEVIEIMPKAVIYCETYPLTGYSPYTFKLSPRNIKTGSFPIDQIDWNPGDGSPTKTVTRYTTPDSRYFFYNQAFFSDPLDPRNYDFIYTLTRNSDTYPVFYPSLTCYSACTNSADSCSVVVGPILLQPQTQSIEIVKAKNTTQGDFLGVELGGNITVLTTLTAIDTFKAPTQNQPTAPIKPLTIKTPNIYFGNTGENYPLLYTPGCEYISPEPDLFYLATEEDSLSAIFLEDSTPLYK